MRDAIVIGGGLSGLLCAQRLVDGGATVTVFEARDRVGGRLFTGHVGGALVDLGGQWLTAGQHRLVALARELGVATYEHERQGAPVVDESGGFVSKVAAAFAQRRAIATIDRLMRSLPEDRPADAPHAAVLDRVTLAAWLDETVPNKIARERIRMHADLVFAAHPADISLLSYLSIMRVTGGFRPSGPDLPGGGREHRFEGGAQLLATRLCERLAGIADIVLGERVVSIVDHGTSVTVTTTTREEQARRVVLAIPPVLAREIAMTLSAAQRTYIDGMRTGPVVKCFAAYSSPFWRERGLSGEAYLPRGTVRATVELAGEPPVLLAFVVGPPAARWSARDPLDRRAEVLAILAAYLGEPAERPLDYLEQDWAADPLSKGCVAATGPDVLARGAQWRGTHGNVHVAGTEAAVSWPGYMEGAIEAGERAAADVLAALGK